MAFLSSCADDDDNVKLKIMVAIRDDLHVPEYVTVFGQQRQLSDNTTWVVTLESFRIHEFTITVPSNTIPSYIDPIMKTNDPRIEGIFSFIPSRYNTTKNVMTVHTEYIGNRYSFTLTP